MCAKFIGKLFGKTVFDPSRMLADLASRSFIDDNGSPAFRTASLSPDIGDDIAECFSFHDEIPEAVQDGLVTNALFACGKTKSFSKEDVEGMVTKFEREYLERPFQNFVLHSSIGLDYFSSISNVEWFGVELRYYTQMSKPRTLPPADVSPIKNEIENAFRNRKLPSNYTRMTAHLLARCPHDAAQRAFRTMAIHRALINWWENMHVGQRWYSGRSEPVNVIPSGPLSTVHLPSGKVAIDMFWYEPDYISPIQPYRTDRREGFAAFRRRVTTKLRGHAYRMDMERLLIDYSTYLDQRDYDLSIIGLWSVLERLSGVRDSADNEKVVTRASVIFKEREKVRDWLQLVRRYRNELAHEGKSSKFRDTCLDKLRAYVEQLLSFHVRNKIQAKSLANAGEVLDLAATPHELENKLKRLRKAMNFAPPRRSRVKKDRPQLGEEPPR